jgi:hypothetical protein
MAHIAKKKLITSKGIVRSGEELPDLPAAELKAIAAAGGIAAPEPRANAAAKTLSDDRKKAEKAVADAEALVESATSDDEKAEAGRLLDEARAALAALG